MCRSESVVCTVDLRRVHIGRLTNSQRTVAVGYAAHITAAVEE